MDNWCWSLHAICQSFYVLKEVRACYKVYVQEIELEFSNVGFEERGKSEKQQKNPSERTRTNNKLNPHMNTGSGNQTQATLVGGECSHHCAIPAPIKNHEILRHVF